MRLIKLTAFVALALGLSATPACATIPGENGKIAFDVEGASFSWGTIYTIDPDGSNLTQLTPTDGSEERTPAWSPGGTQLVVSSRPGSTGEGRLWVENADGTGRHQVTFDDGGPFHNDVEAAWSPDGSKIAFVRNFRKSTPPCSDLYEVNADGTSLHQLEPTPRCHEEGLVYSPDGTQIAYTSWDGNEVPGVWVAESDNSNPVRLFDGQNPSWSPSGEWIVYNDRFNALYTWSPGVVAFRIGNGVNPEWSPDGRLIASGGVTTSDTVGGSQTLVHSGGDHPAWQPRPPFITPPGYPRPRGAKPLDVSLVPAFQPCESPNSTHGAPLAFASCSPPTQTSSILTAGTPDANGLAAQFVGRATLTPIGDAATPPDDSDVRLRVSVSDVRCRIGGIPGCGYPLADYTGSLRETFELQITDENNGGSAAESATVRATPDFQPAIPVIVPCVQTADPSVGSSCAIDTTADAIVGGVTLEGKRSTWELGQVRLWDAGEDGNPTSDDNTLFAVQGVFVP